MGLPIVAGWLTGQLQGRGRVANSCQKALTIIYYRMLSAGVTNTCLQVFFLLYFRVSGQMFRKREHMRASQTHQPLTYDVRLPDEAQADALRLLDASRAVINQALTLLWPSLDEFGSARDFPVWKQVGKYTGSPQYHGDRQWRCESETVGRILRAQAERKKAFDLIHPILSDGFIRPKTDTHP